MTENINAVETTVQAPVRQLPANRSLLKTILLSFITCGIYALILYTKMGEELNLTASRYDGKKTMHFCLLTFIVAPLTCGIGALVWFHKFSNRIGDELKRRNIDYKLNAGSFWFWNIVGSFIIVGPLVYYYKLIKAINLINANYNIYG